MCVEIVGSPGLHQFTTKNHIMVITYLWKLWVFAWKL